MTALSLRQRILKACQARLELMVTPPWAPAYDGAVDVLLGEVTDLGPDDPPAMVSVVPGDDDLRRQGDKLLITLPIELQAVVRVDIDDALAHAEELLAAIKRAFELPDRTLGGLVPSNAMERGGTRILPREAGQTTVGLGVTYMVDYQETWGAP